MSVVLSDVPTADRSHGLVARVNEYVKFRDMEVCPPAAVDPAASVATIL